jgi:hypothetical protein
MKGIVGDEIKSLVEVMFLLILAGALFFIMGISSSDIIIIVNSILSMTSSIISSIVSSII